MTKFKFLNALAIVAMVLATYTTSMPTAAPQATQAPATTKAPEATQAPTGGLKEVPRNQTVALGRTWSTRSKGR